MESVPNEILIEIFTHVQYWDLKIRLPLVCRRFYGLLKADQTTPTRTAIDKSLFRDAPLPRGRGDNAIRNIHPVFDLLYYRYTVSIFDIDVHYDDRVGPVPRKRAVKLPIGGDRWLWGREWLASSKIGRENAVSPAVTDAMLQVSETRVRPVKGTGRRGAITVIDVMENMMRKKYGTHWHPTIALQDTWKGIGAVITEVDGTVHLYPQFATVTEEDREYTRLYKATYGFSRNLRREGVWGKLRRLRGNGYVRFTLSCLVAAAIIYFQNLLSGAVRYVGGGGRIAYLFATPLAYITCSLPQASLVSRFSLLAYFFSFFDWNSAFYLEITFVMLSMMSLTSTGHRWTVIFTPRVAFPVFGIILHLISTFRKFYQRSIFGPGIWFLRYVLLAMMITILMLIAIFCRTFFSAFSSLTALGIFFAFTFL